MGIRAGGRTRKFLSILRNWKGIKYNEENSIGRRNT
jgi:hypothetical protein